MTKFKSSLKIHKSLKVDSKNTNKYLPRKKELFYYLSPPNIPYFKRQKN